MYRILILWLLAIGFFVFAVDSSEVILQAQKIRETSTVLSWTPMENAEKYKVFYDELDLIDLRDPTPLLATEYIDKNQAEIRDLMSSTEYYFIVHGYDRDGNDIGKKSLPLHARTFRAIAMDMAKDAYVRDKKTIVLTFTRPIDVTQTEITVKNTETQKLRTIWSITTDPLDTRIVSVQLKGSLDAGVTHEVLMKKVTSLTAGIELPAEKRIPLNVIWTEPVSTETTTPPSADIFPTESTEPAPAVNEPVMPAQTDTLATDPVDPTAGESSLPTPSMPTENPATSRAITEPVPIDKLPQTWPIAAVLLLIGALGAFICKKSSQRIGS